MKRNNIIMHMLALLSCAFCMASCDVHEFPDILEKRAFHLRLNYDTDMTEWKHLYDGENMIEEGLGETYDNRRAYGNIRYVVRAYPWQTSSASRRTIHRSLSLQRILQKATTTK